jgi:hypothetical protein
MSQNNDIIEDIKRNLTERVNAGQITTEQLIKINNLATNPAELKKALRWL